MMLHAEQIRSGEELGSWNALNEVVVARGQSLRPVRLSASVDGRHLTSYVADGLIASTATGSTAYALAAGGPILPPELRNILLVPIAPHLSVDRAVVLAEGSMVSILVRGDNAVLSIDGQPSITLMDEDHVDIRAAEVTAQFVRFGDLAGSIIKDSERNIDLSEFLIARKRLFITEPRFLVLLFGREHLTEAKMGRCIVRIIGERFFKESPCRTALIGRSLVCRSPSARPVARRRSRGRGVGCSRLHAGTKRGGSSRRRASSRPRV